MSPLMLIPFVVLAWTEPVPDEPLDPLSAIEKAMTDAIARAEPSVVAIAREKSLEPARDDRGEPVRETYAVRGMSRRPPPLEAQELDPFRTGEDLSFDYASGVVIGSKNLILTTFHSVRGAARLKVRAAGRQFFEAEIIAADPRSDLAVLAPREAPGVRYPTLTPIKLGDAETLRKGSFLIALGNPYNAARDGSASASWGILANRQRRIEMPIDSRGARSLAQLQNYPTLLQLDTKLNLGMSGGAVVNLKGELVGLTTASANVAGFDAQAGYAIPIDPLVRRIVDTLREGKEVEYGFLGILLDSEGGTNRVREAQIGTPAGEGGVLTGDAIVKVGDRTVNDSEGLVLAVNAQPVGKPVRIVLRRGERIIEKTVVLAKYPIEGEVIFTNGQAAWRGIRVDWASTMANQRGMREELKPAMARGGVRVVEVRGGSSADSANLKKDQLILTVNGKPTRTPAEFARAVESVTGPAKLLTEQGEITVDPE